MNKRKFTGKGQAILGNRDHPSGIADILGDKDSPAPATEPEQAAVDEKAVTTENRKTVKTESRKDDTPESRNSESTENRKTDKPIIRKTVKSEKRIPDNIELPPKREEFKLPGELAERLRDYVFAVRSKKTHVVIEALDEYLKSRGY